MRTRSILFLASAATIMATAVPASAQASTTENVDRRLFDSTPERTAASLHLDGPTAGELGGAMDLTITAKDGTLPTTFGSCEPVKVNALVTVRPGTVLKVRTGGEACAHIVDGSLSVNAFFDKHDVRFKGCKLRRAKLIGDGLIAASESWLGAQASFSGTFRW